PRGALRWTGAAGGDRPGAGRLPRCGVRRRAHRRPGPADRPRGAAGAHRGHPRHRRRTGGRHPRPAGGRLVLPHSAHARWSDRRRYRRRRSTGWSGRSPGRSAPRRGGYATPGSAVERSRGSTRPWRGTLVHAGRAVLDRARKHTGGAPMKAALDLWLLLRRRTTSAADPHRLTGALAVLAFAVTTAVVLVVIGGFLAFTARAAAPGAAPDDGMYVLF